MLFVFLRLAITFFVLAGQSERNEVTIPVIFRGYFGEFKHIPSKYFFPSSSSFSCYCSSLLFPLVSRGLYFYSLFYFPMLCLHQETVPLYSSSYHVSRITLYLSAPPTSDSIHTDTKQLSFHSSGVFVGLGYKKPVLLGAIPIAKQSGGIEERFMSKSFSFFFTSLP